MSFLITTNSLQDHGRAVLTTLSTRILQQDQLCSYSACDLARLEHTIFLRRLIRRAFNCEPACFATSLSLSVLRPEPDLFLDRSGIQPHPAAHPLLPFE